MLTDLLEDAQSNDESDTGETGSGQSDASQDDDEEVTPALEPATG